MNSVPSKETPANLALLQAVLDNQATPKLIEQIDGSILMVNQAACTLFGYLKKELLDIGKSGILSYTNQNGQIKPDRFEPGVMNNVIDYKKKSGEIFQGKTLAKKIEDGYGNEFLEVSIYDISPVREIADKIDVQEQLIENLLSNTSDIIAIVDSSGKRLMINDAVQNILGYSRKELTNQRIHELIYVEDRERTSEILADLPHLKHFNDFRNRLVRKDGSIAFMSWNYKYDEVQRYIYCTGRDITNISLQENDLIENKILLSAYDDYATDALFVHDFSGRFIEVNQQACKNLGYTRDELLQMNVTDIELNFDITSAQNEWLKIEPSQPFMLEGLQLRKNGTTFPVEAQFGCFDLKNKRYYIVFVRDISARKHLDNQLKKSESAYRALIENLNVGVLKQGIDAEIQISNSAALEMLGLTYEQLIGKTSFDPDWNVIHTDGSPFPGETHPVPTVIRTGKPVADVIMGVYRPASKDRIWLLVNADPHLDELGKLDYVICIFQDVSESFRLMQSLNQSSEYLKKANEDLKIKTEQLKTSNIDLEHFAYAASHDLQEPLRMITGFLMRLQEKYSASLDEKGNQYINFAVDGATRMKQLINDILNYSRVNTNQLIEEIRHIHRREIENINAVIVYSDLPTIKTYKTPVKQIFDNLIGNAIKYCKTDTPLLIEITWSETPGYYQFSVKDNGIGISPEYHQKIFIIFNRLHSSAQYPGSGIGLAIAKRNAELLGGKIWVESELNIGSTFHFTIAREPGQSINTSILN